MRTTSPARAFARRAALLAGAVLFAAAAAQAMAPKSGGGKPGGGGGGGGGSTGTDFSVEVADDGAFVSGADLWVPTETDSSPCYGWAAGTSVTKPDYFARWRVDGVHLECQDLTTSTGAQLTDDIVVRAMKDSSGNIDRIQLTGQDLIGTEGLWHQTDVIPVAVVASPSNGGFTIHVHARDVTLWKCNTHLMKKQTTCNEVAGTFSLDDMVYIPNSTSSSIESTIRYAPGEQPQ